MWAARVAAQQVAVPEQRRTPEGFSGVGVWLSLVSTVIPGHYPRDDLPASDALSACSVSL